MIKRKLAVVIGVAAAVICPLTAQTPSMQQPRLLTWSKQIQIREGWLAKRHELLLPMMRRHAIDMWIVVNEEFHNDPLTEYVAPPRPYAGGRDVFLFVDAGEKGLKKIAATGYAEENVRRFFETPVQPGSADKILADLFAIYQPKRIGLSIGGRRGVQRSLTHDSYLFLSKAMGPEATSRFVSAADLIEEYLATRIPGEFDHFATLVQVTDVLARRALSNEVITPGETTVGDVRRWLYDAVWAAGARTWFQPDIRVQRKGMENKLVGRYIAVADEGMVIERGDVILLDFGVSYIGFDTDWQRHAYVLRAGERDASSGLKRAMANTNTLQDVIMLRASRSARTAGQICDQTMVEMAEKGIEVEVYSHAIGNQGHGLGGGLSCGAGRQMDPEQRNKTFGKDFYLSLELNTHTPVAEWNEQTVIIAMEDDVHMTDDGFRFFLPRQEQFYLIK